MDEGEKEGEVEGRWASEEGRHVERRASRTSGLAGQRSAKTNQRPLSSWEFSFCSLCLSVALGLLSV